jgi:hypothetical protein
MKKLLLSFVSVFLLFALSAQVSENFTDYTVGGNLAQQAQTMGRDYWTTWSNAPGGNEDGVIDEMPAGNKCLKLAAVSASNSNDQVLRLGNKNGSTWDPKTSGAWELTFKIYIPATKDGYFNIKSVFPSDVSETWAMQIYFATDEGDPYIPGVGKIYGGSSDGVNFNFSHDTWIPIKVFIDLDDDVAEFYVNNNMVHTYQYSLGSFGQSNNRTIAAMNIFPPSGTNRSTFYIDDIVFASVSGPQVLFETNFDELSAGAYVAQSYPAWWTTWTDSPGTAEDALITTEQAQTPLNSAKCAWGTDLMFLAGDKTSGVYTVDFDMYIPTNQRAYFNLLHFFDPGNGGQDSEWAIGVYFNVTAIGPQSGTYVNQNGATTTFTFPFATWFPVSIYIDLDNDEANIKINNNDVLTWQFSTQENGGAGERQLGRIDIFPPQSGATFYFDNFKYATLSEVETFPIIDVTPTEIAKILVPGNTATETITVSNTGTSVGDYYSWVEIDFDTPPSGSNQYSLAHCNDYPSPNGLGFAQEGYAEMGVKFSHNDICDKIGSYITKMSYYLADMVGENKLTYRIYAGGNGVNSSGELLMEFVKTNPVIAGWNEITLPTPLLIEGELWLSVSFIQLPQTSPTYPIGYTDPPQKVGVNWFKRDSGSSSWNKFWDDPTYGNIMIKAHAEGGNVPGCWIKLTGDTYGTVPKGSDKTFKAEFNAEGIPNGLYKANIVVTTTDNLHPEFIIPCTLMVGNGPIMSVEPTEIFEVIQLKDGDPTSATVAVKVTNKGNEAGTFDAEVKEAGTDWLTLSGSIAGVAVPAGENKTFDAVLEAAELADGTYEATIVITTSDEYNPLFEIPCKLVVSHVGIDDYTIKTVVFPNPANDLVNVKSNTFINTIQVFNNMGQMVLSTNVNGEETTINTANLNAGIYFMKVNTTEGSQNVKLIIK